MELAKIVEEPIEEFLEIIPISRWERMTEPMTWSEIIEGKEIQFEVNVIENEKEYVRISVDVDYPLCLTNMENLTSTSVNYTSSFILNKNE